MKKSTPRSLLCLTLSGAILLGAMPTGLQAQSIDASRYVNAQGVEVIQGRRAPNPVQRQAPGADSEAQTSTPATAAKQAANSIGPARARPASYQIGEGEQQQRDRDRLAILEEEIHAENVALASKIRVLQNPEMRKKLDGEQLKRMQETTLEHEKNIRALSAEIGRAKRTR